MRSLGPNDYSEINDQQTDDMLQELAEEVVLAGAIDTLTYNAYAWQRSHYGVPAERLAPHFPRADKYEEQYQRDLQKRAA